MSESPDNIVVTALKGELTRARNRLDGARKRLDFATGQVEIEARLLSQYETEVDLLSRAIIDEGGVVPPPDLQPDVPTG